MNNEMTKNDETANLALALMHAMADAAADVVMPLFRSPLDVGHKEGKGVFDPVTEADRRAEAAMREMAERHFPEHGIIGEEHGSRNPDAEYCWIFDPIDGTRAFIIGAPSWGTLIGLAHKGVPVLGMMNQPFTGERFWGDGREAFLLRKGEEAQRLQTGRKTALGEAIISTTSPDLFAREADRRAFDALAAKTRMVRYGLDCLAYCLLAMGLIDIVAESGLATHDIAPLVPIIRGAGGIVTRWDGGDPSQGGAVLASANEKLHDQALNILGKTGE